MAIKTLSMLDHWEYFLALEDDIYRLSRFIDFSEENYKCYSIELVRLLLSCCSEVDVLCKLICRDVSPGSKAGNIDDYRKIIPKKYEKLPNFEVKLKRFGLELQPWANWEEGGEGKCPNWWADHTDVKHHRHEHFPKASLSNVLNAAAALFVLLLYFYRHEAEIHKLAPNPLLFTAAGEQSGGLSMDVEIGEFVRDYPNLV